ncbi:MAG: hypothetical protein M3N47_14285 [Chloroflexota bacterium]|nr:hypothetical protein [Chloroflexota bacterium]
MSAPTFDAYVQSLGAVAPAQVVAEPEALDLCTRATAILLSLQPLSQPKVAAAVAADPDIVPVLAAAAGQSQERFKGWLKQQFGTEGWIKLGRQRSADLVAALDKDFGLLTVLEAQMEREWTWADVLARVMAPRQRAGSAIQHGRDLEDDVQAVIDDLSLTFTARASFEGTAGQIAPADFAIPAAGPGALIAVAVKGFDSTGSKLTDARREIEEMAKVRRPTQFIFAVVDGIGWLRRKQDLHRIHALWTENRIDGVYTRTTLPDFRSALSDASRRLGLV